MIRRGILVVTALITAEAIRRLANPLPVEGGVVVVVALVGLVVNTVAALAVRERDADLNTCAAVLHLASDAMVSAGVAATGAIILAVGSAYWLDPAVSLVIGLVIGAQGIRLFRQSSLGPARSATPSSGCSPSSYPWLPCSWPQGCHIIPPPRRTSPGRPGQALIPYGRYHHRMAMISARPGTARTRLAPAAALFRSLADPTRLAILQRLARGPARVVDLTSELGLAQSTISKHLACLRDCGLVDVRPAGRASVYSLAQPGLSELLSAAETVLAATGNAVALCPTYGRGK